MTCQGCRVRVPKVTWDLFLKSDLRLSESMAMDQQYERLGDILKAQGIISAEQLEDALDIQERKGLPLGRILTEEKLITEAALAKALAFQKNLELVDLTDYDVNVHAASLINEDVARRFKLIPIGFNEGRLVVAVANPLDVHALDSMQMITGFKVEAVVATGSAIDDAISSFMRAPAQIKETVEEASRSSDFLDAVPEQRDIDDDVPVVKLANTILSQALRQRASDVHIESAESNIRVRYRVDGVLREAMKLPRRLKALLVSRFKIMSGMDITERRRPQDGRMSLNIDGSEVQFRVATLPGIYGESVTLRLLTGGASLKRLNEIGLDEQHIDLYRRSFERSYGAVLVTGPTGSGKTTTLYSMLNELNTSERKIITIEDPIEYSLDGVTQIQINRKVGVDFAAGLRAIVRADPDVVMVGEIRDLETAQIGIRAALTGHLVLSSLHTNDASSALTRLVDMGVDPFLVTSSVHSIMAQRLGRLLCPHCKKAVVYDHDKLTNLGIKIEAETMTFYEPGSCRKCQQTGHYGRIGIFELLMVNDEIIRLCHNGAGSAEIKKVAVYRGMRTLYKDGIMKARQGLVSIDEVRRVVL